VLRKLYAPIDIALGSLFAVLAVACGVVGFVAGLQNNSHANQWYLAGLALGILAGAVLIDELITSGLQAPRRYEAALGTILMLAALGFAIVGWIAGLANNSKAPFWQIAAIGLAVLALTTVMDEMRRARRTSSEFEGFAGLAGLFGLVALVLGAVGFILGLLSKSHAYTWLYGGIVSSVIALAFDIEAEHATLPMAERAEASRQMGGPAGATQL